MAKNENVNGAHNDVHYPKEDSNIDICTDSKGCFHHIPVSFDTSVSPVAGSGCMYDTGVDENEPDKTTDNPVIPKQTTHHHLFGCKSKCKQMKTDENMKTKKAGPTPPLPGILDHRDFWRDIIHGS